MKRVTAVYAILWNPKKTKVLMVHNKDTDTWTLPGGVVEGNEVLKEALVREVYEETGLQVEPQTIVAVNERIFEEKQEHALFLTFQAAILAGEITILNPDEISQIQWKSTDEANRLMPYFKAGIEVLRTRSVPYTFQN